MEPVTKRLHISGLTPAITQDDLVRRLSGFGTVKATDGFGQLDGAGQPRKFGYVTLETTKGQLSKCLNVLSGSTWKGTKLRIGEAKPDYHEKLEAERADGSPPPKKRRKRVQTTHAPDMSLITPTNVVERAGWKVTPMGRIVRPVRMRPERPLEPQLSVLSSKKNGPKKVRIKGTPARARRRTIDPTKWDSVHLKGMFLETEGVVVERKGRVQEMAEAESATSSNDSDNEMDVEDELNAVQEPLVESQESADSPISTHPSPSPSSTPAPEPAPTPEPTTARTQPPVPLPNVSKLKDLFVPREEEVGFSLLGQFDVDLELDDGLILPFSQTQPAPVAELSAVTAINNVPIIVSNTTRIAFDPNQPFFFPLSTEFRDSLKPKDRNRVKDLFDVAKEKGWNWRDAGFYRTQTEDEIRKRWEDSKVELTRDWKKRLREAGKLRRRRGGGDGE